MGRGEKGERRDCLGVWGGKGDEKTTRKGPRDRDGGKRGEVHAGLDERGSQCMGRGP